MLRRRLFLVFVAGISVLPLRAVDISPSKDETPNETSTNGPRFSIYSNDPDRIQKANSINFQDFLVKLDVNPPSVGLAAAEKDPSLINNVRITLSIKNTGGRTYTLAFPTTERYEITIKNPAGQTVYRWSLDKKFLNEVGLVMINPTDRISYAETVGFNSLYAPLETGDYTVECVLANYPEIAAKAVFKVLP